MITIWLYCKIFSLPLNRTPNFIAYERSLETINNQLSELQNRKRILTATEVTINVLKYLGYISIVIVTIYFLYKVDVFRCMNNLLPKSICVKLFCHETTIRNTAEPRINYSPSTEIVYETDNQRGQSSPQDSREDIIRPPKLVRFGTKRSPARGVSAGRLSRPFPA